MAKQMTEQERREKFLRKFMRGRIVVVYDDKLVAMPSTGRMLGRHWSRKELVAMMKRDDPNKVFLHEMPLDEACRVLDEYETGA